MVQQEGAGHGQGNRISPLKKGESGLPADSGSGPCNNCDLRVRTHMQFLFPIELR